MRCLIHRKTDGKLHAEMPIWLTEEQIRLLLKMRWAPVDLQLDLDDLLLKKKQTLLREKQRKESSTIPMVEGIRRFFSRRVST